MIAAETFSQQQVMFTQYMFNGLAINPAYAGSHETISLTALAREQWTGIEGAPSTQTFSIHSPIKKQRMSLGLLLLHDRIGVTDQTGVYGSYAYRIPISDRGLLSFGLQGGFSFYKANFSQISPTDPVFANGDVREIQPNIGFGLYYNTEKFFIGASAPQLIETQFDKNNTDSDSKLLRHYFLTAGYVFELSPSLKLKPSGLIKYVDGAPLEIDLNANLLINEIIWVGFSWRSFDSVDLILQLQITDQLQFGYSYDIATTSDIRRVDGGSHEVTLNYRFSLSKGKVISPRYF
jgi:type IX secretion system PorP/SprF family membrane protein